MYIGFTGHQRIDRPERWGWVQDQFKLILGRHATPGDIAVSSLAAGGDQLFSEAALAAGLGIEVVVPCIAYERAFSTPEALDKYEKLLVRADRVIHLEYPAPSQDAFLAAGMRVVEMSGLVVALWNGWDAAGRGGTGDVVSYARRLGRPVVHVNPGEMQVAKLE